MKRKQPSKFIPLKKRFNIPSSPPSSDDENDFPPEPTFVPPPPYKQQAVDESVREVAGKYNKTTGRGETSRISGVRNFNNWIKSMLINTFCPEGAFVLDICGGRGGDLHKFNKRKISFLVLADNAEESVKEAENRYTSGVFSWGAYFICEDCLGVDICKKLPPNITFDLVNCQFALHYSFRNENSARTLLSNVSSRLRPGCHFIGTTVDDVEFMRRYGMAQGRSFGNSLYRVADINFDKSRELGFGCEYSFFLEEAIPDIKEYFVPFDKLTRLAREYDLELVYKYNFSYDFNLLKFNTDHKPPPRLQRDEREICNLYCIFVFKKAALTRTRGKVPLSENDIRTKLN